MKSKYALTKFWRKARRATYSGGLWEKNHIYFTREIEIALYRKRILSKDQYDKFNRIMVLAPRPSRLTNAVIAIIQYYHRFETWPSTEIIQIILDLELKSVQ